jgi:hypothetical protein
MFPVDISYLIADLKYSTKSGLKICEVQHGYPSALTGDAFIGGQIPQRIADYFDTVFRPDIRKWAAGVPYYGLIECLNAKGWITTERSLSMLELNQEFLDVASRVPSNPRCVAAYHGIVYASRELSANVVLEDYQRRYPGIVFIDAATLEYWADKIKMNSLFGDKNGAKADWMKIPKQYDPLVIEQIFHQMPAEMYVIKPRSEYLGNGIIIVTNSDLDQTLKNISDRSGLSESPYYKYWARNRDNEILIETFYESDEFIESVGDGLRRRYDLTMRIAFILQYDQGQISYHSLGGYWKLPFLALDEEGTLNQKRMSYCKVPYYRAVDPDLYREVDAKLQDAMITLYGSIVNRVV